MKGKTMIKTNIANAKVLTEWIANRGGIAVWNSIDLSDPTKEWFTPALDQDGNPYKKPSWQADNNPTIVTETENVLLFTSKEVKRFHVGIRKGSQGMVMKVTDAGSERIRKACEKFKDSWYEFDYLTQDAVILVPENEITLTEYLKGEIK
jgi:hypothetical protein